MHDFIINIVAKISVMPAPLKFIFLILSTTIEYIFPVFPGDTIVIFSGFLAAHGAVDLLQVFIAIGLGSLVGATATFAFGRYLAKTQNHVSLAHKILPINRMAIFQIWYKKWGYLLLLFSRFVPGIRSFFFIAAGFSGLSLISVLVLGTLSSLLFNACLLYLGNAVGRNTEALANYWQNYSIAINCFIFIAFCVGLYFFLKSRSKP